MLPLSCHVVSYLVSAPLNRFESNRIRTKEGQRTTSKGEIEMTFSCLLQIGAIDLAAHNIQNTRNNARSKIEPSDEMSKIKAKPMAVTAHHQSQVAISNIISLQQRAKRDRVSSATIRYQVMTALRQLRQP